MNNKELIDKEAREWVAADKPDVDPLITYLFVNKNLDMSHGKIGVQTARAAQVMLLNEMQHEDTLLLKSLDELFQDSFMHGNKTICVRANESQMNRLMSGDLSQKLEIIAKDNGIPIRTYPVYDIGATEVEPNSLTVVAMTPVYKSLIQPVVKKFQLY